MFQVGDAIEVGRKQMKVIGSDGTTLTVTDLYLKDRVINWISARCQYLKWHFLDWVLPE